MQTLARQAVRKLRSLKVARVRLAFDDSYFTGPAVNPAWPASYVPEGVVPPISSLWVDQGADPDGSGFLADPAAGAAAVFAAALRNGGLKVAPQVTRAVAPPAAVDVAAVSSAPLGEIVERTLAVSDNQAAEVLARHVGLAERQEGSFEAGAAAVVDVVRRLGVPVNGDELYDGSGLSRRNLLSLDSLAGILRLAESPNHPHLRQVFTGLPVAGFTGSLQYRFDKGPERGARESAGQDRNAHRRTRSGRCGRRRERWPDGIRGGRRRVGPLKDFKAQVLIDRIAGALGACTCRVGSSS